MFGRVEVWARVVVAVIVLGGCSRGLWQRGPEGDASPYAADAAAADAALGEGQGVDAGLTGDGGATAAVTVSNLRAAWTTPTHILWTFETRGLAGDLDALELVIAESAEAVRSREGSPDIRRYERATINLADDADLGSVNRAMTRTHAPATTYFAQLSAIDTGGARSETAVIETRTTAEPQREIVIFADDQTKGYSIPAELVHSDRAPFAGTHHYEWPVDCAEATCYQILRRQDLQVALGAIDRTSFDTTAFFEFAMASNSTVPTTSRLRIWFGTADDHDGKLCDFGHWSSGNDDQYRRFQIPLRALEDADGPVPYEVATSGLFEFGVDGTWSKGALVRLDEWRVRW